MRFRGTRFLVLFACIGLWTFGAQRTVSAQTGWELQNPAPTGDDLYGISFINQQQGWAVGGFGDILYTANGGSTWDFQSPPSDADLYAVSFVDANNGWAVGNVDSTTMLATIIHTVDGGITWTSQTSNTAQDEALYGVVFVGPMNGWAVGTSGTIVVTADGGNTWTPQASGTTQDLNGVGFAADGQNGWAVGIASGSTSPGTILHTTNGGGMWTAQTVGQIPVGTDLYAVAVIDQLHAYIVGDNGTILQTVDGGATWTAQSSGTTALLLALSFIDPNTAWIVGDTDQNNMGTILHTVNGGGDWTQQPSLSTNPLFAVSFFGNSGWAAGGGGTLLHTADGATWGSQNPATTNQLFGIAMTSFAVSPVVYAGFAVGDFGAIAHTGDSGNTWTAQRSGTTSALFAVTSVDPQFAWAAGDSGTILRTRDGGANWTPQVTNVAMSLFGIQFIDGDIGWAVGDAGTILHTTNGGATNPTWMRQAGRACIGDCNEDGIVTVDELVTGVNIASGILPLQVCSEFDYNNDSQVTSDELAIAVADAGQGCPSPLNAVFFLSDALTGWAAGEQGTIVHTTDGGATWRTQMTPTTVSLFGITCGDPQNCWAVGGLTADDPGGPTQVILHTADGGNTWTTQAGDPTANTDTLFAVTASDRLHAWTVGDFGVIMGTIDGGANWIFQESGGIDPLNAVSFVDSQHVWTDGDRGTILNTTSGGF